MYCQFDVNPKEISMDFTHNGHSNGLTASRLAGVALFHVLMAFGIVASMKIKVNPITHFMPEAITEIEKKLTPPPEPTPTKFETNPISPPVMPRLEVPLVDVPPAEIVTRPPPVNPPTSDKRETASGGTGGGSQPAAKVKAALSSGSCETPVYPASAVRDGATGKVRLSLLVGTNGRVSDFRIDKSSGHRALDKAAGAALSLCRFTPASVDGVPEATWTVMEYIWTLDQ
jgi:protein TonB